MGKVTWATPNGRPAHEYLSEGISASHGRDVKGPTVALTSMARGRNLSYREKEGDLINLKFSPASVAGEEGTRRLMQIIRTWCDLKHWHVQFNILNRETLLAAQQDPEKYRSLIVRIAGYSAYFVDLSPVAAAGDHQSDGRAHVADAKMGEAREGFISPMPRGTGGTVNGLATQRTEIPDRKTISFTRRQRHGTQRQNSNRDGIRKGNR